MNQKLEISDQEFYETILEEIKHWAPAARVIALIIQLRFHLMKNTIPITEYFADSARDSWGFPKVDVHVARVQWETNLGVNKNNELIPIMPKIKQ